MGVYPFERTIREVEASNKIATVFIAGDYDECRVALRHWCADEGDCWALERVDYIYSGGEEAGIRLTRIDYPRFPSTPQELQDHAERMGAHLIERLYQTSCTVVGPVRSVMLTRHKR